MAEALDPIKDLFHRVRGVVSRQRSGENGGLRIVKEPPHAEIDIVAVHGLGGEGFRSWITFDARTGSKPKSWLSELLAKDMPNARIMTYGYISDGLNYRYLVRNVLYGRALDLVKELGAQRLRDGTGRRPVVFIAHSLGGWIVKRALIISSEATEAAMKDIELSTCGVAFFGTLSPGRPSSPSPLAHVLRRTTSGLADEPKRSRAMSMTKAMTMSASTQPQASDIEWLENQMEAFKAITANLPRLSFHETKKSSDGFVVEKRHSMAGSGGIQIGLTATHSDLIKFQGRDANYNAFIDKFREMIDKARTSGLVASKRKVFDLAAVHHLEYLSVGFAIPYKLPAEPAIIVPRSDLVTELEGILNPPVDPQSIHLSIATLWGLPGTGKTTLAKHYAQVHSKDISFVFWIRAESWETMVASYLELANALVMHYAKDATREQVENDLGLMGVDKMLKKKSILLLDTLEVKSVVRAVKDWLMRPQNDKWLLVFDHVESSYDIYDFIPLTLSGKVIMTSRDINCCSWGTKLEVGAMNEEQAVQLLETVVGTEALEDPVQAAAGRNIVQQLNCHPQEVALAASTIRKKKLAVSDYQQRFGLKMSMNLLGSTIDQSPVTKTILRISAMLSTTVIPVALFSATSHVKEAPARFTNIFSETKTFQGGGHFDDVLQHLWEHNFIQTPSPTDSISSSQSSSSSSFDYFILDPAARNHVRSSLTPDEWLDHAWLACNMCVDGIREQEDDSQTLPEVHDFGRIMAPHAKACYDDRSDVLERWPEDDHIAWQVLGNVCMTQGAVKQAIGCFELALNQKAHMDPVDWIQTSLSLASLLQQTNEHEKSQEVLSGIDVDIPSIDKALGFRVAMAKASAAAAQGQYDRAEDQYEVLEHEVEEFRGPTDNDTVSIVHKLASTLEHLRKLEEAQALYRRVYLSYRNIFGQSHPMTLDALEDLAHISQENNAIDEAEALYRQSLDIRTRTLGAEHPKTALALQKLAVIDDKRWRHTEARAKYQRALDIMAPTVGRAHPMYTTTLENMALSARLHGHALGRTTSDSQESGGSSASGLSGRKANALLRETRRRCAFDEAERLYLDVVGIKRSTRELYSNEDVLHSGEKLREMYENEEFFAEATDAKVEELLVLLRDGRRRGTL